MWKYVKKYLHFAIAAGLFMIGEVSMDLIQPGIMSKIVDEGVLGLKNSGISDLNLIWLISRKLIIISSFISRFFLFFTSFITLPSYLLHYIYSQTNIKVPNK